MAAAWSHLGILAYLRGDYDEAARQYQRALDIRERLGNEVGMAATWSQLGILENERGVNSRSRHLACKGTYDQAPPRRPPGQAVIDLRCLAARRRDVGAQTFTSVLTRVADDTDLAETTTSLLDQLAESDDNTA